MNTDEKFEELYSNILAENTQSLEYSREGAKSETIKNGIIVTIIIVIGIILYSMSYKFFYPNDEIVELLMLVYGIIGFFVYFKIKPKGKESKISEYKNEFKTKIIKALLNAFNENIEYSPIYGISSNSYNEAEFEKYDRYRAEDLMKGTLKNNCNFEMSEVLTEHKYKDSDGNTHYSTLFCGMLAKIETPKPFNARLYLRKDRKDKNIISRAFTGNLPFNDLRVDLDSQEFEKYFDVYCTDKIIAMQLLTADIMQLLVNFQEEMDMEYELTIKNNCIYIRFMSGEMFETANVTKFSLDKNILYKYYRMLDFSITLTNKLINLIKETEYNLGGD